MPKIVDIVNEKKCYGCYACVNSCNQNAIKMKYDACGFPVPSVDLDVCVNCGACDRNCSAIAGNLDKVRQEKIKSRTYSVRNRDKDVRMKSSSGGLFTVLGDYILSINGCVAGAVWGDGFLVRHIVVVEKEKLGLMRQSKYLQSEIGDCFREIKDKLHEGKVVLFTGTPCQNAALKLFLAHDNCEKLILCDVLCGGNVSPQFFKGYLKHIEQCKNDTVKSVCFRTKKFGWKQHHIRVECDHSHYEGARKDNEPFFDLYLKKLILRPSCFSCQFASTERLTDITIGDFWGINTVAPEIDDDEGISFLEVNTEKGNKLIRQVLDKVLIEEREISLAVPKQINLQHAPSKPSGYDRFWADYISNGSEYVLKNYTKFGLGYRIRLNVKRLVKHILRK